MRGQGWHEIEVAAEVTTVAFAGLNADTRDRVDIENLRRSVLLATRKGKHPSRLLVAGAAGLVASAAGFAGVVVLGLPHGLFLACASALLVSVVVFTAGLLTFEVTRLTPPPASRDVRESYELVVSVDGFAVLGGLSARRSFALDEIDRFEGGLRLVLRRRNGTIVALPCSLEGREHGPLADRLNELVRGARLLRAGYRGSG